MCIFIYRSDSFSKGDSGRILYVELQNKRLAVGMVIGKISDRYQAILLRPALRDIELDYSLHVANFESWNYQSASVRPPQHSFNRDRS